MNALRGGKESLKNFRILLWLLIAIGLYISSLYSYLLFHSLAELFSVSIAFSIFILAWNFRRFFQNRFLQIIAVGYFFSGIIDLIHTLAYTLYSDAYGFFNLFGHYIKILSYYFIYKAIVVKGLMEPYDLLFRDIKRHRDHLETIVAEKTMAKIINGNEDWYEGIYYIKQGLYYNLSNSFLKCSKVRSS